TLSTRLRVARSAHPQTLFWFVAREPGMPEGFLRKCETPAMGRVQARLIESALVAALIGWSERCCSPHTPPHPARFRLSEAGRARRVTGPGTSMGGTRPTRLTESDRNT